MEVLTTFLGKMANSQYGPPTRKEVLKSGIRRYYRKVHCQETGGPKLYRNKEELEKGRKFKELLNKRWYRPKRGGKAVVEEKEAPWQERERIAEGKKARREERVRSKEGGRPGAGERGEGEVKVVESVVFVPYTLESKLKEKLQKVEENLTAELKCPSVRFVERGGRSLAETLSRNNPWAREGECPRKACPPCWGRRWLAAQEEREAIEKVTGEKAGKEGNGDTRGKKEDKIALSCCTKESINYTIECITCRLEGRKRIYWGESSRSGYQRGQEHHREIIGGVQTHPLVLHFAEEHDGTRQEYLMRVTNYHKKALERQVLESIRIEEGNLNQEESLNLKSEWAASKLPGVLIRTPKGVGRLERKEEKRIRYEEGSVGENREDRENEVSVSAVSEVSREGGDQGRPKRARCEEESITEEARKEEANVVGIRDVMTREEREARRLEEEKKRKASPKTFSELELKLRVHSWSPGKEPEPERGKGRRSDNGRQAGELSTPVRVKVKRLEGKGKDTSMSSPRNVNRTKKGKQNGLEGFDSEGNRESSPRNVIRTGKEEGKPQKTRAIQTKIQAYLSSTRSGEKEEAIHTVTALRRSHLLGGFGSMSDKGAQKTPGKPPSLPKVGRVSGGKRKVDGKGKFTSLEKWLSRTEGQEAGLSTERDGRQGNSRKEEGLGGGGDGREDESKEGIAGGGGEPACH